MPIKGDPDNLFVGKGIEGPFEDIRSALSRAAADKADFVSIPLAAPGGQGVGAEFQPSVESQFSLEGDKWRSDVVGVVSESLDPDTASSPAQAEVLRACLETELRWASHLGLRAVLLPPPAASTAGSTSSHGSGCSYARAVGELLLAGLFSLQAEAEEEASAPVALRVPLNSSGWHAWNRFRSLCDYHQRLSVALELVADKSTSDRELERWLAEPVRFVLLPSKAFVLNPSGYPVLPKRTKALLTRLFRYNVRVVVSEPSAEACSASEHEGLRARLEYVARLFQGLPPLTFAEQFAHSHLDTLQAPLQPLADNLESETYELFEKDPVKYAQYEEAVYLFLKDKLAAGRAAPFCVMVLGAGRGPLVAASIRAGARAEVQLEVWAVDKNPNAVHALRHRKKVEEGWGCVQVVAGDMRSWQAPRKADVIVSELLGSFGDNELSPECIDGAQRFLAEDGVCIPQSYTASLTPVSAPGLWADARNGAAGGGNADLETAYVVNFHHAFYPCSSIKDCFEFRHPNWALESNDRYVELQFDIEVDSVVHGFAGYFDCVLYGDAKISIHPKTFSEGMFSWFPIFFPLRNPEFMRKGSSIRSHWWRRHDARQVWYEWALSEPAPTPVQNPGGRSFPIGLL
eukprot:TRINITY_DN27054_c0_g1_i1.p1 TRINITY_DN27054_c0_g1~~TRINITY_DN27054_c0_g1_i1.p1  ORF type:complete len:630 (+),score=120.56 TRINITY_DN27054_c0_g1_i1:100-1989(+)